MPVKAKLQRVSRPPISTIVFDQLFDQIVDGEWAPGSTLPPERQLCTELGVSRTAVREALARLAQLNLIAIRHGGETRVLDIRTTAGLDLLPQILRRSPRSKIALEVARSGFEMRAALAPDMARLAAERRTGAMATELADCVASMLEVVDVTILQQASLRFWSAVAIASDNLAYQLAFNTLRASIANHGARTLAVAQSPELRNLRGYRAIADAIIRQDPGAAHRAARAHIAIGLDGINRLHARTS